MNPVEDYDGRSIPTEADEKTPDGSGSIFISSIGDTGIRSQRQAGPALQVFAEGKVERLAFGSSDSIRAGPRDDGRPPTRFCQQVHISQRRCAFGQRIVLDARLEP